MKFCFFIGAGFTCFLMLTGGLHPAAVLIFGVLALAINATDPIFGAGRLGFCSCVFPAAIQLGFQATILTWLYLAVCSICIMQMAMPAKEQETPPCKPRRS